MLSLNRPIPLPDLEPRAARPASVAADLTRILVALAAWAALVALGTYELDRLAAAETAYLARIALAALLAIGFVAPGPARELGLGAALAVLVPWTLPRGPVRASTLVAVLGAALLIAAVRRLRAEPDRLAPGAAAALAFGLQALLRGRLLFDGALFVPKSLFALLALPVAAGLAASFLSRRSGAEVAALALGATALLAPGWNVAATLALVALAAGEIATDSAQPRPLRGVAALLLALPFLWEPRAATVALVAALARAWPRPAFWASLAGVGMLAAFVARSPGAVLVAELVVGGLAVAETTFARRRPDFAPVATVALLGFVALWIVPGPAALAAPIALAVLAAGGRSVAHAIARAALPLVAAPTVVLAAYPWLRADPLAVALGLFGLPARGSTLLVLLASAAALGFLASSRAIGPTSRRRIAALAAGAAGLSIALGLPPEGRTLLTTETALTGAVPHLEIALDGTPLGSLRFDTHLENGAALAEGTPVAIVRLLDAAGRGPSYEIDSGFATGEWAAERPDLVAAGAAAPEPWLSWVAGDFFGHRYRAGWLLDAPFPARRLTIERAPGLPADVVLALHQVEVLKRGRR